MKTMMKPSMAETIKVDLYDHQRQAVEKLKTGAILCGGVGTGKSRTAIAYYFYKECDTMHKPRDLYIITTAKKRDSLDWEKECLPFLLSKDNPYGVNVIVDSWNNIQKYKKVVSAFFIFDEQRVVGSGAWVKAFIRIARQNDWILLSATPGDTWKDYIPVFVANGFYKHKSDFFAQHAVFNRFAKYPKIEGYVNTGKLVKYRNDILVKMNYERSTVPHRIIKTARYCKADYITVWRDRWDIFDKCPIQETGKLFYLLRKVVNSDLTRAQAVKEILQDHDKAIIFYNFDYELDILRELARQINMPFSEWNGQKHEDIPKTDRWIYLVQYAAGAEGWNCIETNTIIFYSLNYSYRSMVQAEGRVDRLNTKFKDLYYYRIKSNAPIDIAISRALAQKKNFNEKAFLSA